MAIIGELVTVLAGNNAPLMASVAQSEAALKGYSTTASTHHGIVAGAAHAAGLAMLATGAVAAVGLGLAAKSAGDFQEQMAIINTIAHQTPAELTKTGDSIRAMAVASGTSLSDLTKAFYVLLSAGVPASHAISVLGQANTLAIGGLATTSQTVDLLTTAINAYHLSTGGAKVATDQFALAVQDGKVVAAEIAATFADVAPLAKQAGIGIDEITTSYAVLTARGTPAAEAMTQMNRVMVELLKPSKDLSDLQEKTHLNFAKIAADKGLVVALQEMREAAAANNVPFQDLFGRLEGLKFALATTGPNFAAYAAELDKMHHANGTAAAQAAERMGTFHRQTAILGESFNNLLITVGTPLLPFLSELVNRISGGIQAVQLWAAQFPNLGAALASLLPATGPVRAAFDAIASGARIVADLVSTVGFAIADGLGIGNVAAEAFREGPFGQLGAIVNTVVTTVVDAVGRIPAVFNAVASAVSGPLNTVAAAVGSFTGNASNQQQALTLVAQAAGEAQAILSSVGRTLSEVATAVGPFISQARGLAASFLSVVTSAQTQAAALGILGQIINVIRSAIAAVVSWLDNFISHLTGATNTGQQTSTTLSTLGNVLSTVATVIGTVVGILATVVGGLISAAHEAGIFKAAGDAIYVMFGLLGTALRNIFGQFGQLAGIVSGALSTAFNAFGVLIAVLSGAFKTLADSITNVINLAKQAVDAVASVPGVKLGGDIAGNVGGAIGNLGGAIHGLTGFASGGVVPGSGPQLAVLHGGETVTPEGQGGTGSVIVHTHLSIDGREIAELIEEHLFRNASAYSSGFAAANPVTGA